MKSLYDPHEYWQRRLSSHFNLRGVGYAMYSERYNRWLYRQKRACIDRIFREVSLHEMRVLDVGCGTGFFVDWYVNSRLAEVAGIDITEVSVQRVGRKYRGDFQVCDISGDTVPFSQAFDIVNMFDVIYHIVESEHFLRALSNVARACKRNAYFLVTDRFGATADTYAAAHVRFRCLHSYFPVMDELGFSLIGLHPLYYWLNRSVTIPAIDNVVAPIYYILDRILTGCRETIPSDNLSLAVWRYGDGGIGN